MGDDEVCDVGLGVEVVVNHDAMNRIGLASANRQKGTNDVAESPHTFELAMVAHDDEVGGLDDGAHLVFMTLIDKDVLGPGNPFEEIGEDVGGDDMDVSLWHAATKPRCQGRRGADGIAVGAAVAGDDDMGSPLPTSPKGEELVPEGALVQG